VILEARERVGGRVLSEKVAGSHELGAFDLGPTWFWPRHEPTITALVKELGLNTFAQYTNGLMLSERSRNGAPQTFRLPDDAVELSLRFDGGVQALIDAVVGTLPAGSVQFNSRVLSIRQAEDESIEIEIAGRKDCVGARAVIVALPPRLVARTITFSPELDAELLSEMVGKPTWMAAQAKAVAVYSRPFWREQGLSGFATSWVGPLQEIHDASPETGAGALFGFFGMPARMRSALGERRVKELVVEQLVRLFGADADQAHMIGFLYKDWFCDSDTAVDEDAEMMRDFPNYGPLFARDQWEKKLIFAGTETVSEQGGHLEAALRSAERAVAEFLTRQNR
jgi:monoamine oxidase